MKINKILHTNYVDDAGIDEFEHIRVSLRNLMKYLPKNNTIKYDTNFTDEILSTEWSYDDYTSVAYWYQTLPSAPLMPLPTDAEMCMR